MPPLCRDANVNAMPRRGAVLCSMHNAEVLIIMVMRGEIRPMQMRKDESAWRTQGSRVRKPSSSRVSVERFYFLPNCARICLYTLLFLLLFLLRYPFIYILLRSTAIQITEHASTRDYN